jgi:hypothetical protein
MCSKCFAGDIKIRAVDQADPVTAVRSLTYVYQRDIAGYTGASQENTDERLSVVENPSPS